MRAVRDDVLPFVVLVVALLMAAAVDVTIVPWIALAAAPFIAIYEVTRSQLVARGLSRTPWFAITVAVDAGRITVARVFTKVSCTVEELTGARLVYQERFDSITGIDDTLWLQTRAREIAIPESSIGFDAVLKALREANVGVLMVRTEVTDVLPGL